MMRTPDGRIGVDPYNAGSPDPLAGAAYTSLDLHHARVTPTGRYSLETGRRYEYGGSCPSLRPRVFDQS